MLDDSQQKLAELARRETELRGMIADRVTVQRWAAALNRREKSLDLWHYVYFFHSSEDEANGVWASAYDR
ncbi:hypothetical protein GCM10020001_055990 [Nonomuraea salmonea]